MGPLRRTVSADERTTRDKLLDAAALLFAERGIRSVALAEIVREAGQRNASAVHYHLGSRDDVLLAVLQRAVPPLRERRLELLEAARATDPTDVRAAAEAVVRPVVELAQRGWRERAYLQIGAEVLATFDQATPEVRHLLLHETAGPEAMTLLAERCPPLPAEVWRERAALGNAFIGRAAADRARRLDRTAGARDRLLDDDRFVAELVSMYVGAMTAPPAVAL
jgi:AcrR family transcriptional regulator